MANRDYRILIASDRAGLVALAGSRWTILQNTVREFDTLDSDDDRSLGDIGGINVQKRGWVALAYKT